MEPMTFPSGFVKREFVVRTDEMYPQEVKFELYKDKISLIDSYKLNEQVKISFNIKGSQWEGRFFTNLQVSGPAPAGTPLLHKWDAFAEMPAADRGIVWFRRGGWNGWRQARGNSLPKQRAWTYPNGMGMAPRLKGRPQRLLRSQPRPRCNGMMISPSDFPRILAARERHSPNPRTLD